MKSGERRDFSPRAVALASGSPSRRIDRTTRCLVTRRHRASSFRAATCGSRWRSAARSATLTALTLVPTSVDGRSGGLERGQGARLVRAVRSPTRQYEPGAPSRPGAIIGDAGARASYGALNPDRRLTRRLAFVPTLATCEPAGEATCRRGPGRPSTGECAGERWAYARDAAWVSWRSPGLPRPRQPPGRTVPRRRTSVGRRRFQYRTFERLPRPASATADAAESGPARLHRGGRDRGRRRSGGALP